MNDLREILKWFPTGTAEGDREILQQVFVYIDEFSDVLSPPNGSPHLLIGRKGSGKSAILDFSEDVLKLHNIPVAKLTPTDIDSTTIIENSSTGDATRIFFDALILSICKKMSETSTGWVNGDFYTMYAAAVDSGQRSPDLMGRIGKFFAAAAMPALKIDIEKALPHLTSSTRSEISNAVSRALVGKKFYLFIDDTDQVVNPDKPGHLNRVWSLLLAVRMLCRECSDIKAIVSLRTEVWSRLKRDQAGQRDQTDHFSTLIVEMPSGANHVSDIVRRRLDLAATNVGSSKDSYAVFFEGNSAKAPGSNDLRSWQDLIAVRSRGRPRDAIQLVNRLARRSLKRKSNLISQDDFAQEMPDFSKSIAENFSIETSNECQNSDAILRTLTKDAFNDSGFSMTAEHALEHFKKVLTRFGVTLYGISLTQNEASAFELWRFFYLNGVLNARVSDAREKDGYRHLDAIHDPTLVSKARWNDLQKTMWELNTAFRDYVSIIGDSAAANTGLATKEKFRDVKRTRRRH